MRKVRLWQCKLEYHKEYCLTHLRCTSESVDWIISHFTVETPSITLLILAVKGANVHTTIHHVYSLYLSLEWHVIEWLFRLRSKKLNTCVPHLESKWCFSQLSLSWMTPDCMSITKNEFRGRYWSFRSSKAERGYTLAAFPSYIDQTVAGAISTGAPPY